MACTGRFAEAWEFSAYWCHDSILTGVDNSGLLAQANLTDTTVNFVSFGIQAGVGQVLYNLTASTSGVITAVTNTTITAAGVTWNTGDSYRVCTLTRVEMGTIEHYLNISVAPIHAAMQAQNACSCTLASWAANYLAQLNIIAAAMYYTCPCMKPNLSDEMKQTYLAQLSAELVSIRKGEIELCAGETGADFPAIDWAEQSVTDFAAADIIWKR